MTILDGSGFDEPEVGYPTDWHSIDANTEVSCRQLSDNTYQLRSPTHTLTLNKEGFDLYRDNTLQGQVIFGDWCARNNVAAQLTPNEEIPDGSA